ncbi:MAG: metal-sensitive transcriptional regulator [Candidatus Limnocylindrales bacterium]
MAGASLGRDGSGDTVEAEEGGSGSVMAEVRRGLEATPDGERMEGPAETGDFRHSYSRDRAVLVRRLRRIEGQVRGITRMIEREEYCIDILQQTAALRAAVDAVALLVLEDHVQGCVRTAAERGEADRYVEEVLDVVRRTLGRPVRSARSG